MKTRLEEIEELLKLNGQQIHLSQLQCGAPVDNKSLWELICERVKLGIEKHDIVKAA